jgi:hypothetical protein
MIVIAKYTKSSIDGSVCGICVVYENGTVAGIPLDPANTDYANLIELEKEGKIVIQPADGTEQ